IHEVLTYLLKPLSNAKCEIGYEMVCADGNVRLYFPRLFYCLADYIENTLIYGIVSNYCSTCITPVEKLDEYSETSYPYHSHIDYAIAYKKTDTKSLNIYGIKNINNTLWSVPNLKLTDLVRVDILHNILFRVLDHLIEWI
ncbi:hypothetical protein EV426DRAFT_541752, partial [Tirmania nivea]